ncbi:Ich1 protein [Mycena kentingensis (nom. inval.)]|nr:Ich1 protein [Mycena kentingensis (nom. inval.)]
MTFAVLRALHTIIGDALDDIEHVYSEAAGGPYASPPPSPTSPAPTASAPDFPSLDAPSDPLSTSEQLTTHPTVAAAITRIVAAAGQISATVHPPFLTLCDASMGYHLPSCLRLLEAAHIPEILRDGPLHVRELANKTGVEQGKLAHILRLLATHHLLREVLPDVFASNRISSLIDSGKPLATLQAQCVLFALSMPPSSFFYTLLLFVPSLETRLPSRVRVRNGSFDAPVVPVFHLPFRSAPQRVFLRLLTFVAFYSPERKYDDDASAVAAFVGLCCDELHKSSAYLTEAVFPGARRVYPDLERSPSSTSSPSVAPASTLPAHSDPTRAPFNHAFGCAGVGYFAWLEGEGCRPGEKEKEKEAEGKKPASGHRRLRSIGGSGASNSSSGSIPPKPTTANANTPPPPTRNPNQFRLERFGKAMAGTGSWEAPGAVLAAFDWASLPPGSTVVDVGGGIGSTTMVLAGAYAEGENGLRFVVQDREFVVDMGQKAWRAKCPELLDSSAVRFQVHDFFTPQPILNAAVYFLRVVLHDWPDAFAQKILLRLREAAGPETRLVIGDWVLPMACVDNFGIVEKDKDGKASPETSAIVEGAEKMLAPAPLLANLGKASANVYWMDLTMQVTFNGQERTLREIVSLAASAGWKVVKVVKAPGSLFGHIVAVPVAVPIPAVRRARAGSGSAFFDAAASSGSGKAEGGTGGSSGATGEQEENEKEMGMGMDIVERASSRCGTPTFGSRVDLPYGSVAEARRVRTTSIQARKPFGYGSAGPALLRSYPAPPMPTTAMALKQAAPIRSGKKRPSPLSGMSQASPSSPLPSPLPSSASTSSLRSTTVTSPFQPTRANAKTPQPPATSPVARRARTPGPLRSQKSYPHIAMQSVPPSPMSPPPPLPLSRQSSYTRLSGNSPSASPTHQQSQNQKTPKALRHMPSSPVLKSSPSRRNLKAELEQTPSPPSPAPGSSRIPALMRRASVAQLPQSPQPSFPPTPQRQSGTSASMLLSPLRSVRRMGSLLLPGRASGGALDFAKGRGDAEDEGSSGRGEGLLPAGSVLAEAARIERGGLGHSRTTSGSPEY